MFLNAFKRASSVLAWLLIERFKILESRIDTFHCLILTKDKLISLNRSLFLLFYGFFFFFALTSTLHFFTLSGPFPVLGIIAPKKHIYVLKREKEGQRKNNCDHCQMPLWFLQWSFLLLHKSGLFFRPVYWRTVSSSYQFTYFFTKSLFYKINKCIIEAILMIH